jgi:hypothetical protein
MAIGVGLHRYGAREHELEAYVPEVDLPVDDARYPYLRLIDPTTTRSSAATNAASS